MVIKIEDNAIFDVPALVEILGVKERTIRKMLSEGQIKGKKLGRKWYITGLNLRSYFSENSSP